MEKPRNITQELFVQCSPACRICRGHILTFASLRYRNPDDNKLFGLVSGNLQRHLKSSKHRDWPGKKLRKGVQ